MMSALTGCHDTDLLVISVLHFLELKAIRQACRCWHQLAKFSCVKPDRVHYIHKFSAFTLACCSGNQWLASWIDNQWLITSWVDNYYVSLYFQQLDIALWLIQKIGEVPHNFYGNYTLWKVAVAKGSDSTIRMMHKEIPFDSSWLSTGCGMSLLFPVAAEHGNIAGVNFLLEVIEPNRHPALFHGDNNRPLHKAIDGHHWEMVKWLITHAQTLGYPYKLKAINMHLLVEMAKTGCVDIFRWLLDEGYVTITMLQKHHGVIFKEVCQHGHQPLAQWLVNQGYNIKRCLSRRPWDFPPNITMWLQEIKEIN